MWKEPQSLKHVAHLFPTESSVFNCRTNVSGLPSRRPFTLAKYVWLVLRVWCTFLRNGLQGCMIGTCWATAQIQQAKGFTDNSPALYCPVPVAEDTFLSGAWHYRAQAVLPQWSTLQRRFQLLGSTGLAKSSAKSLDINLVLKRDSYWQTSPFEGFVHF